MPGRFLANLQNYATLTATERQAVEGLTAQRKSFPTGAELFAEGETSGECRMLLQGQAFRHKTLADGRRQIMCYHVPGDFLDFQRLFLGLDYSVTALTACELALIPRANLAAVMDAHPRVAQALWRITLVESAVFREWMVGMGRRTAYARIAHLLCEVVTRMGAAGLMHGDRCRFAATQTHLADSLGLSVVHTNRVLQALRRDGLIDLRGRELVVLDWKGLQTAGEFDRAYLHLGEPAS